jgi:hypothetical protein
MRAVMVLAATLVGTFVIVAFTASILETWAAAQRYAEPSSLLAHQPQPQRSVSTTAGFLSGTAQR